jgi:hypothetical protein
MTLHASLVSMYLYCKAAKSKHLRLKHRWEDNFKTDFREVRSESESEVWIELAQETVQHRAFVNTIMNF